MKMLRYRALLGLAGAAAMAGPAVGQLTGSGRHLPIPSPNPGAPTSQAPVLSAIVHPTSFTGTWSAPALSPWIGSFSALGPVPSSPNQGTTDYGFAGLAAGNLPSGTLFHFGDVDQGTSSETLTLRAFDPLGAAITMAWLDVPSHVWGMGSGPSGALAAQDMPGWSVSAGVYTIDGTTVPGNPVVSFVMHTLAPIGRLVVEKPRVSYAFGISAPTPAPGAMALLGMAGVVAARRRR